MSFDSMEQICAEEKVIGESEVVLMMASDIRRRRLLSGGCRILRTSVEWSEQTALADLNREE